MSNIYFDLSENVDDELRKLASPQLSYSRLDTYQSCPAKYFYTYIEKIDRPFAPYAVLGNIIHDVLEQLAPRDFSYEEMVDLYNEKIKEWDSESQIDKKLIDNGLTMLNDFYDLTDGKGDENIEAVELPFSFTLGRANFRGFIDRVEVNQTTRTVTIVDYKTGSYEITYKDAPNNLQLGIYALAASLLYPDYNIRAELFYLKSGRRKGHDYTKEDLDNIKLGLIDLIDDFIYDDNFSPTKNTAPCRYCDHALTRCPVGKVRFKQNRR